ncbi:MAG: hypothetical protein SNI70_06940 [Rikenellaceae bacterium]
MFVAILLLLIYALVRASISMMFKLPYIYDKLIQRPIVDANI